MRRVDSASVTELTAFSQSVARWVGLMSVSLQTVNRRRIQEEDEDEDDPMITRT